MKKTISMLLMLVALSAIAGDNSQATVDQNQGKYIFIMSKPTQPYTYLGTVKIKIAWTGMGEEMINIALKKVLKQYPEADGIIFTRLNLDVIDAIKFK